MACSKEFRVPKEWSRHHHNIVNEPIDPELFSQDDLCTWFEDLGLCRDRSKVAKYVLACTPYHLMRHQVVHIPNNALCRELFKLWTNSVVGIFVNDDVMEKLSEDDMQQICNAFQFLADQILDQFPQFPTIAEMKQTLLLQKVDEKFIPHVIYFLDFANNVAKSIIKHSDFSKEDVNDYWRRLIVTIAFFYEGVEMEVKGGFSSYPEEAWTRILQSATIIWLYAQEIMSGLVGKITEHLPLLNELYFLATLFCTIVNDIYSYKREMTLGVNICNLVKTIAASKEISGEFEAVQKCVQILNELIKVMYAKIEKAKEENPANQELWKLLDNIGMATVGWYFFHHYSPRYVPDCLVRLSIVEVEDNELEEWRKCTDEEPLKEVKPLLLNYSPQAKKISDAIISGVVRMYSNLYFATGIKNFRG